MIRIKICGITDLDDALYASCRGADALGFIFSKKSPRFISVKTAKKIILGLGPFLVKTGVFVDEKKERVLETARALRLDALQFHGKESPAYCRFFKPEFKVIKVLFGKDMPFKKKIKSYDVDAFLFDVEYEQKTKGAKTLSPQALKEIRALIKSGRRVIISGGLNIKNIGPVKKLEPYAVDVCSSLEKSIGRKSKKLVDCFMRKAKC